MVTDNILETSQLTRRFGSLTAVNAVDFHVHSGERYALVGPRGAGKTTLISMLCTLVRPTSGIVHVAGCQLGRENDAIRDRVGVVFSDSLLDNQLTVEENLRVRASFYGIRGREATDAIARALATAGIASCSRTRYGRLPEEERRRTDLARALIHAPWLLLLDDLAYGLDSQAGTSILDFIRCLPKETGTSVIQTSRDILPVADADRIAILDRGRLKAEGTPVEIRDRYAADRLRLVPKASASARAALATLLGNEGYRYTAGTSAKSEVMEIAIVNSIGALLLVNRIVHLIDSFEMIRGDIQDAYAKALRDERLSDGGEAR